MQDLIPHEVFRAIQEYLRERTAHAERGWHAGAEDEDTLTGDFGGSLRTSEWIESTQNGVLWQWRVNYKKIRGKVNCRNYYIHGGEPRFDYSANFDAVAFFIDTLEFVFATSDLIEAGWDVMAWSGIATTMSHPFARCRVNYAANLYKLRSFLQGPAVTSSAAK